MSNFGKLKTKIIQKLTESYNNNDKPEIKKLLNTIRHNNEFKELYLFYENFEKKYIDNTENAKLYIEEVEPLLSTKIRKLSDFITTLDKQIGKIEIENNTLYENLDILIQPNNLNNIDKKINAKKSLIEHLTTKKEIVENEEINLIENESLLYTVLVNNFNLLYNESLNEEEKNTFKFITTLSNEKLTTEFNILKEDISNTINNLITENSTNNDVQLKLNKTINEINELPINKYNYLKLINLKNGLN